jgi:hypothetical protein
MDFIDSTSFGIILHLVTGTIIHLVGASEQKTDYFKALVFHHQDDYNEQVFLASHFSVDMPCS